MKRKLIVLFLGVILIVVACVPEQSEDVSVPTPAATSTHTPAPTVTHTPVKHPAKTTKDIVENCLEVSPNPPDEFEFSGNLIFNSKTDRLKLIVSNGEQELLTAPYLWGNMSPKNNFFFFYGWEQNEENLTVINGEGETVFSIEWKEAWLGRVQWVNEEHLLIATEDDEKQILLNILTGETEEILFPFTDLYYAEGIVKIRHKFLAYSPDMEKVIYENTAKAFALYDLDPLGNTVLWAKIAYIGFAEPEWSPNGEYIALTLLSYHNLDIEDVYILDGNGLFDDQITDFYSSYIVPDSVYIYSLSWNSQGTHLAVSADVRKNENKLEISSGPNGAMAGRVLVVDLFEDEIVDYCITSYWPPIWSPDGKYIAADNVIIDLENQRAFKVTDDYIIGWLADE